MTLGALEEQLCDNVDAITLVEQILLLLHRANVSTCLKPIR